MNSIDPSALIAEQFSLKLSSLAGKERSVLVTFLRELGEFDREKLYKPLGFSSLFAYCTDGLRFSTGSAYRRVTVARLLRRFPVIAEFLSDRRLNLARVHLLREVLTEANHLELLERATRGTEKDVELIVATLQPKPDVRDSIRRVPIRQAETSPVLVTSILEVASPPAPQAARAAVPATSILEVAPHPTPDALASPAQSTSILEVEPGPSPLPTVTLRRQAPRMEVHPTSATAWSVKMSVSREFIDEFEQVKAALSHKIPNGNFEEVFRECFRITLEAVERRRCGTARSEPAATSPDHLPDEPAASMEQAVSPAVATCGTAASTKQPSRYIPAAVRRAVWKRDGGICAFVSADGKRCGSQHQVEFHHLEPFATGGPSTESNLALRCKLCRMRHNLHYAASLLMPRRSRLVTEHRLVHAA